MRRPVVTAVVTGVVFVVAAVLLFDRALGEERVRIATVVTPSPTLTESPVVLPAGKRLCITRTLLSPRAEIAELVVSEQQKRPTPALDVVAVGAGYRSAARIAATEPGRHAVTARIEPPDRDIIGQFCVRARGRAVVLVGTTEFRSITRSISFIDGEQISPDPALTFYTAEKVSALGELGGIVDRMTIARGFLGAGWIVWSLLVLVAIGVPVAVLVVLYRALRDVR